MTNNHLELAVDNATRLLSLTVVDVNGDVVMHRLLSFEEVSRFAHEVRARADFAELADDKVNLADIALEMLGPGEDA